MELDTDQLRGDDGVTKPTKHSERQIREVAGPDWAGSSAVRVNETHKAK